MTDDDNQLIEKLEEWEWTLRAVYKAGDFGTDEPAIVMAEAANRIRELSAKNDIKTDTITALILKFEDLVMTSAMSLGARK